MLIYNVTTQLSWQIHDAWLAWMRQTHIPDVVATGCFTHHRLVRVRDIDESEGPTYAVQYFAETETDYQRYMQAHAHRLRKDSLEMWGDSCFSFRSLMEVLH